MKAGTVLIGHYYLVRPVGAVLGLLLMAFIAAAVVFMGMLWPAFRYHHTASGGAAQWDVHVNGPLTQADVDALRRVAGESGAIRAELANRGAIKRLASAHGATGDAGDLYAISPQGTDFALTWASEPLVVSGTMAGPHAVGIDWVTARRLGTGVGEIVSFTQVYASPGGAIRTYQGDARVTAVLATTRELRGLVMRSSPGLQRELEDAVGVVATDMFFESSEPGVLAKRLAALPGAQNWGVMTRDEYVRQSRVAAREAGAQAYGSAGLLVAAGMLFVVTLRELVVRIARRRSSLAILYSLGARTGRLLGVHLLEQLAIVALVSGTGYWLGIELLVTQVGLYPPASAQATLLAAWVACIVILSVACLVMVRTRITEHSLMASAAEWRN